MRNLYMAVLFASLAFGGMTMVGCEEEKGPMEQAGENLDNAMKDAGEKMEDAADKAKDEIEDAVE